MCSKTVWYQRQDKQVHQRNKAELKIRTICIRTTGFLQRHEGSSGEKRESFQHGAGKIGYPRTKNELPSIAHTTYNN